VNGLTVFRKHVAGWFLSLLLLTGQATLFSAVGFAQLPNETIDLKQFRVYPGGQTVGVKIKTVGVLVVGHHALAQRKTSPAELAGLQLGDVIRAVNGKPVKNGTEFQALIQQYGKPNQVLRLDVMRNGSMRQVSVLPLYDESVRQYRIGVYVRDTAAGIGTLTFYSTQYKVYGALGHLITDMDTNTPLTVERGEIVPARVTSIIRGERGQPGEKRAAIVTDRPPIGNVEKNSAFGIFGELAGGPADGLYDKPLPVATRAEVHVGKAEMLTVVGGQKVERYAIEIVRAERQPHPETRGLVIRVTDPRLLAQSGGIVQGMSGSPIVQDGKLVGAVTHVFVNDPTSGYGCYLEWMLNEAGLHAQAG
jgi:stage IV sporulation protein B